MPLPEYACAIIEDASERLLLELRPSQAQHAADALTCFGGRRETSEDDRACLLRELHEELAWRPNDVQPVCELWHNQRFIPRFFRCTWTGRTTHTEAGHIAVWAPWSSLPGLPLSPWHAQVLAATQRGNHRVDLA
jgi:8-oxo-dGTP pyrophosphatase MutT (NUDIX family)